MTKRKSSIKKMNLMKIAIDCRLIGSSGIGTFIENVASYITLNTTDKFVLIGNPQQLKNFAHRDNCSVVPCSYKPFTMKELFTFPTKEVNRCDAFFTPNFNIPFGIHVPIYSMVHDIVFLDITGINSWIGRLIRSLFIRRALKISKAILTVSYFTRGRILDYFHPNVPIHVVYNGVSKELLQYKSQPEETESYIMFLGNLKKHKGIQTLIKAYDKGRDEGLFNDRLYIVGRLNFRVKDPFIEMLSHDNNPNIRFITDADNAEVYRLIASARMLVSPSFYEGFGLTPLEALYLGTPVIVSDIPAHQEIYRDSPAVFFHTGNADDLADKISKIKKHKIDAKKWISDHYSYEKTAASIIRIIKSN